MLLALYLTTTIAAADTAGQPSAAPAAAAAPVVVVHRQPSVPLVAIRLSILADDPPGFAGAGHLVQHIVYPHLRERVGRVGGEARVERSSDAVVYTVTGPATELEYLADVLRSVLTPPSVGRVQLMRAAAELREERLAEWETAGLHVRAAVRAGVFPDERPAAGTEESARRLDDPDALATAWSLLYAPERVSIVAVGDVGLREVESAFRELPGSGRAVAPVGPRDEPPTSPLAPAEATRGWLALAYPANEIAPATVTVLARLAANALRARIPSSAVEVEHWWTHRGQALVLLVAAPRADLAAARSALGAVAEDLGSSLTPRDVRLATRAVRRDMLFYSRTPDRMAEIIGRFADRSADPEATQRFYADVERVTADDIEAALATLGAREPIRVDLPPQTLPER